MLHQNLIWTLKKEFQVLTLKIGEERKAYFYKGETKFALHSIVEGQLEEYPRAIDTEEGAIIS